MVSTAGGRVAGEPGASGDGIKMPKTTLAEHNKKILGREFWHQKALVSTAGGWVAGGPGASGDGINMPKTTLAEHSKKILGREFWHQKAFVSTADGWVAGVACKYQTNIRHGGPTGYATNLSRAGPRHNAPRKIIRSAPHHSDFYIFTHVYTWCGMLPG